MKLLKMIENVSPDDTDMLDEIDARVWCWLHGHEVLSVEDGGIKYLSLDINLHVRSLRFRKYPKSSIKKRSCAYTRSRDALKGIRPDGCEVGVFTNLGIAQCHITLGYDEEEMLFSVRDLPTEELAELHAIIQSIQWERDNDNLR